MQLPEIGGKFLGKGGLFFCFLNSFVILSTWFKQNLRTLWYLSLIFSRGIFSLTFKTISLVSRLKSLGFCTGYYWRGTNYLLETGKEIDALSGFPDAHVILLDGVGDVFFQGVGQILEHFEIFIEFCILLVQIVVGLRGHTVTGFVEFCHNFFQF